MFFADSFLWIEIETPPVLLEIIRPSGVSIIAERRPSRPSQGTDPCALSRLSNELPGQPVNNNTDSVPIRSIHGNRGCIVLGAIIEVKAELNGTSGKYKM